MDRDGVQSLSRRNAERRGKAREAGAVLTPASVRAVAGSRPASAQSEFVETSQGWRGRCALVQMKTLL